jgi:hypothetical protein
MRLAVEGTEPIRDTGGLESPSLFNNGADGPPAFELKFLLTEEKARLVEERVASFLALDRYADPNRGNSYPILSLYTDTPEFDVYRRTPVSGGCKHRVRRYGGHGPIFVEQKTKAGDRVKKRRAGADLATLASIATKAAIPEWPGDWFQGGVKDQNLSPVCRIGYDRVAYLGTVDGGTVRVTFDRNVRGETESRWAVEPVADGACLLEGGVICEFKFRLALPAALKAIVEEFALTPSPVSKYRRFMQSKVAAAGGGEDD